MLRGQVVGDSLVLLLGLPLLATLATGRRAAALRALARSVLTRVRSTVDMPLVSPRWKVTCRSGLLNLCIYGLLRGLYRSLGES